MQMVGKVCLLHRSWSHTMHLLTAITLTAALSANAAVHKNEDSRNLKVMFFIHLSKLTQLTNLFREVIIPHSNGVLAIRPWCKTPTSRAASSRFLWITTMPKREPGGWQSPK